MSGYTPKQLCDILYKNGWRFKNKKGSHITYSKDGVTNVITIPSHKGEIYRGLTRRLLKEAGIT